MDVYFLFQEDTNELLKYSNRRAEARGMVTGFEEVEVNSHRPSLIVYSLKFHILDMHVCTYWYVCRCMCVNRHF